MHAIDTSISLRAIARAAVSLPAAGMLLFLCFAPGCSSDNANQGTQRDGVKVGGPSPEAPDRLQGTIPVVVAAPGRAEFTDRIEALGTARANESVVITAQVTELVTAVGFEDGQVVEAGHVLVELTSGEESAQFAEARVNYDEALRQHRRIADLVLKSTDSRSHLDERIAARDAAAARLGELQARLSDRLIRAPFGGVLGLRAVSPGTVVKPGDEITTLDDIDLIKLDFSVPEAFLASVQPGLDIRAEGAAYPGREFTGRITAIDTRVDPRTRAVRIRAVIENADHLLRPGMLLRVVLFANPRESLALPEQAFVPVGEHQYVFVVDEGQRARRVEVRIGRRRPGTVEVLEGLSGDEVVILEGADQVRSGGPVHIVSSGTAPEA